MEVRHPSFCSPAFIKLIRRFSVPVVYADHATYPAIGDVTGDFVYARLQRGEDTIATAYSTKALDGWAARAKTWAAGSVPDDLPVIDPGGHTRKTRRDVFVFFIHEGKVRAPAAAKAFMERVAK